MELKYVAAALAKGVLKGLLLAKGVLKGLLLKQYSILLDLARPCINPLSVADEWLDFFFHFFSLECGVSAT